MRFELVIGFIAHLQLAIASNYNASQVTITHTSLPSLLRPPLVVAWLQFSNNGYSSRPSSLQTADSRMSHNRSVG
jgi:hypothetical protein